MDIQASIQPHIKDLEPYEPPDWKALAARAGILPEQLIRLNANENPYPPSPGVVEALARSDSYRLYPDYGALTAAIARYSGAAPENVVLGNGGDEIIDLAVRLFLAPGQRGIVCPPAYSMYVFSIRAQGGRPLPVPRRADFSPDVEAIEAVLNDQSGDHRPRLLFLTSPGNPDGLAIPLETIQRLLQLPLIVVVDEAYVEFGGESALVLLEAHPNLLVARTFSKWASMAGLRLGYALTSPDIAGAMARLRPPYNVNAAAVVAALATLDDMLPVQTIIASIIAERERLQAALAGMPGVHPLPSQANFVLCRLAGRSGQATADALAEAGILVRTFSDPALADAIRVTIGHPDQNDAFLLALDRLLHGALPAGQMGPGPATAAASTSSLAPLSPRLGKIQRRTGETEVSVTWQLDGTGRYQIATHLGFLDHMLAQLAAHGCFDLTVQARGDVQVDEHHTVEDVAIGLGQALNQALGDRRGITRMASAYAPLDEALALVVVDLSGRPYAVVDAEFVTPRLGAVGTDLIRHFLETLAIHARISLHARVLQGWNDHHKAEALFKALGRALDAATRLDNRRAGVPSTKGVL
jgi:histidinol-phosphate aminotransferase